MQELQVRDIQLSDVGNDCPKIEVLIGEDIAGKMFMGQVKHLKNGVVAVEQSLDDCNLKTTSK